MADEPTKDTKTEADESAVKPEHQSVHAKDVHKKHHTESDVAPESEPALPTPIIEEPKNELSANADKKPWWHFFKTKPGGIVAAAIGLLVVVGILFAIPVTRYGIAGTVLRKDVTVSVVDSKTGKAVSEAEVSVPGTSVKTDSNGKATLARVPVGQYKLSIKKRYYKDVSADITVPILSSADAGQVKLEATGRQVPVVVVNKLTGQPLEKATVSVLDTTATTDDKGETVIVLPADVATQKANFTLGGYNELQADVTVVEQKDDNNIFAMTPSGKLYFLSKRTGKINVMKSNLDGTDQQIVLQGTGKEEEGGTVMLATRDWKYLMLLAHRDGDKAKMYLINTSNDQMSVVDEGNANFRLSGWMGHTFVYAVDKIGSKPWEIIGESLKSFDADSGKLAKLDGVDAINQAIEYIYLLDAKNTIVYSKRFDGPDAIVTIEPNGNNKKVVKEFDDKTYVSRAILYAIDEVYYQVWQNNSDHYYEYEDGVVKEDSSIKQGDFTQFYPTWLLSPNGQKTFWYEPRDGKNTLLIGDKDGKDGKEVAQQSEYTPYGWYTDEYLLVSKGGSELYIIAAANTDLAKIVKITDYHKPNITYRDYGGGYGGGF